MAENYEEPQFEILKKYKKFEVRKYTDTIQARVSTDGIQYITIASAGNATDAGNLVDEIHCMQSGSGT